MRFGEDVHLINFRITADEASDQDRDNTWRNTKYFGSGYRYKLGTSVAMKLNANKNSY